MHQVDEIASFLEVVRNYLTNIKKDFSETSKVVTTLINISKSINNNNHYLISFISHIKALKHNIKVKNGESIYLRSVKSENDEILKQADIILKKRISTTNYPSDNYQNSTIEKASIFSRVDDVDRERRLAAEQNYLDDQPLFHQILDKLWIYSIENRFISKKIFISYAWPIANQDNEEWTKKFVEVFAQHLISAGFQVYLDVIQGGAGFPLDVFMEKIKNVDHIFLISSRTMKIKLSKPESGVSQENKKIKQYLELTNSSFKKKTVIPILLNYSNYCDQSISSLAEVPMCVDGYMGSLIKLLPRLFGDSSARFEKWFDEQLKDNQLSVFNCHNELLVLLQKAKEYYQQQNIAQLLLFYVEPDATDTLGSKVRISLQIEVQNFLNHKYQKILLLLGDSGAGKSLFTACLEQKQWQEQMSGNYIPLRIELKAFNGESVKQCISQTLKQIIDKHGFDLNEITKLKKLPFLFILDGYDEIAQNLNSNLYTENHLEEWTQSKVIITCRTQYFPSLMQSHSIFMSYWNSNPDPRSLKQLYLAPFSNNQIENYLEKFLNKHTEYSKVKKYLAEINELLSNPFILKIFCEALPLLIEKLESQELKENIEIKPTLNRLDIYQAFMQYWFSKEEKRIEQALIYDPKYKHTDIKNSFEGYSQKLAYEMFIQKTLQIVYIEVADEWSHIDADAMIVWKRFFSSEKEETVRARQACPLRIIGDNCWSFVHKSFQEYFISSFLWKELEILTTKTLRLYPKSYINQRLLPEEPAIVEFMVDYLNSLPDEKAESMKQQLINIVKASKVKENQVLGIASANAITILNYARISLSCEDFSDVCIKGADLSNAILEYVNFSGADLEGVNLTNAYLPNAVFSNTNLKNVTFGQRFLHQLNDYKCAIGIYRDGCILSTRDNLIIKQIQSIQTKSNSNNIQRNSYNAIKAISSQSNLNQIVVLTTEGVIEHYKLIDSEWERNYETSKGIPANSNFQFISLSGCGKYLALANTEKIFLYNISQYPKDLKFPEQVNFKLNNILFNYSNKSVLAFSSIDNVKLWSEVDEKIVLLHENNQFFLEGGKIESLAFDYNYQLFAVGTKNEAGRGCQIYLYQQETSGLWKNIDITKMNMAWNSFLCFSLDSKYLASASDNNDNKIKIFELCDNRLIEKFNICGHYSSMTAIAFFNSNTLISSSQDRTVRCWELTPILHNNSVNLAQYEQMRLLASPWNHEYYVYHRNDDKLRFWGVKTYHHLNDLELNHCAKINCAAFSPSGNHLITGTRSYQEQFPQGNKIVRGHIYFWEKNKNMTFYAPLVNNCTPAPTSCANGENHIMTLVFISEDKFASGAQDGTISVWQFSNNKWDCEITFSEPTKKLQDTKEDNKCYCLIYHSDKKYLASSHHDGSIRIWQTDHNYTEWKLMFENVHSEVTVRAIAFSKDGRYLVSCAANIVDSGSKDLTKINKQNIFSILIWEVEKISTIKKIKLESSIDIRNTCFINNGKILVTSSHDDGYIRFWDWEALIFGDSNANPLHYILFENKPNIIFENNDSLILGNTDNSITVFSNDKKRDYNKEKRNFWFCKSRKGRVSLVCHATMIENVKNLSDENRQLLIHHGAIERACISDDSIQAPLKTAPNSAFYSLSGHKKFVITGSELEKKNIETTTSKLPLKNL